MTIRIVSEEYERYCQTAFEEACRIARNIALLSEKDTGRYIVPIIFKQILEEALENKECHIWESKKP